MKALQLYCNNINLISLISLLDIVIEHIYGLVQDRSISTADALEIPVFYTKPPINEISKFLDIIFSRKHKKWALIKNHKTVDSRWTMVVMETAVSCCSVHMPLLPLQLYMGYRAMSRDQAPGNFHSKN